MKIEQLIRTTTDATCWFLERVHWYAGKLTIAVLVSVLKFLGKLPWSVHFGLLLCVPAFACLYTGLIAEDWIVSSVEMGEKHIAALAQVGILQEFRRFSNLLLICSPLYGAAAILAATLRRRITLYAIKTAVVSFLCMWCYAMYFISRAPAALLRGEVGGFDASARNELWIRGFLLWFPFFTVALLLIWLILLKNVAEFYGQQVRKPRLFGDELVENLKKHGGDKCFRTSLYWAAMINVLVITGPFLLRGGCTIAPYKIPKGTGQQTVQKVVVKRIKKKKKKKKYVLNMNSPIIYYVPDLDDTDVLKQVEDETLATYQASAVAKLGKGGKGKGGWPNGMENANVRFIRLKYGGGDWNQDMGKGADYNLLIKFHELTGFRVAKDTEAIKIQDLRRFPRHGAPPFVFITGKRGISVSSKDIKTLRHYCLAEGGMIFADNGGGSFNSNFRRLMRRVFPNKQWIDISDDDIIFQRPFHFPDGAPPFWHHSGTRALGIRHNNRWVVFYHQGDVNDAWKTGHSGISPEKASTAYRLGVNIINYAFNEYMRIHYGD